ncbi:MAG: PaaI family thioesterase [Methanoregulaceae archaeon]|nr:PaaI family thioesterase [Methanoregulaceae archaeon]
MMAATVRATIIVFREKISLFMNYIERIQTEGRDANPFFTLMGIETGVFGRGSATLRMTVRPDMLNGEDFLQGGLFTALADEAMVLAIYTLLDPLERIATISETTTFMSGVRQGVLIGTGRVLKKGRRVIFAEGDITLEGSGQILSRSTATFMVTRI